MSNIIKYVPPTLDELIGDEKAELAKLNDFAVLLNNPPAKEWVKFHPMIKTKNEQGQSVPLAYMPIEKVEYLLTRLFVKWNVEIKAVQLLANSVCVTVRLHYQNPVTGEMCYSDGVGASPLQTKAGAGAIEFNALQSSAVQMAAPAAESYAVKDAAEKLGRIFGKDLNRHAWSDYTQLAGRFRDKDGNEVDAEDTNELWVTLLSNCKSVADVLALYKQNQDLLQLAENAGILELFSQRKKELKDA